MVLQLVRHVIRVLPSQPLMMMYDLTDDYKEQMFIPAEHPLPCSQKQDFSNEIALNYLPTVARMSTTASCIIFYIERRLMDTTDWRGMRRLDLWLDREAWDIMYRGPLKHGCIMLLEAYTLSYHMRDRLLLFSLSSGYMSAAIRIFCTWILLRKACAWQQKFINAAPDFPMVATRLKQIKIVLLLYVVELAWLFWIVIDSEFSTGGYFDR